MDESCCYTSFSKFDLSSSLHFWLQWCHSAYFISYITDWLCVDQSAASKFWALNTAEDFLNAVCLYFTDASKQIFLLQHTKYCVVFLQYVGGTNSWKLVLVLISGPQPTWSNTTRHWFLGMLITQPQFFLGGVFLQFGCVSTWIKMFIHLYISHVSAFLSSFCSSPGQT